MRILSLTGFALVMAMSTPASATTTQSRVVAQIQPRAANQARQVRPAPQARQTRPVRTTRQTRTTRQAVQPNWERCFKMSVDRGFDHDEFGEWLARSRNALREDSALASRRGSRSSNCAPPGPRSPAVFLCFSDRVGFCGSDGYTIRKLMEGDANAFRSRPQQGRRYSDGGRAEP